MKPPREMLRVFTECCSTGGAAQEALGSARRTPKDIPWESHLRALSGAMSCSAAGDSCLASSGRIDARREAFHYITLLELACCWCPTGIQPLLKNLHRVWPSVPHGDRLNCAQSGGAVDQPGSIRQWHQDIVSEFILSDDIRRVDRG